MTPLEALAIFSAGIAAGAINTVVGSGTLITFPILLAFGYGPVVANVSNAVGLVPGAASGTFGYRRELTGRRALLVTLGLVAALGAFIGAILLLTLPASAFRAIVPYLIVGALILVTAQPWLANTAITNRARPEHRPGLATRAAVSLTGVYGGYFGAAQSVVLLAIFGLAIDDDLQHVNALKVAIAGLINLVAAIVFAASGRVAWPPAVLIAVGSTIGGGFGARVGRRLPPAVFRATIVAVGVATAVRLLM
jgi:uncharacterized membrane protein YfcA